ncbi:protein kinase [Streptomyces sp. NBC_00083]|uniref:protein kinase domain-containing protein n=1 Tax=Streptomyces sp. NBC_00083 TaxID=2975647 RepID=UPI002251C8B0|nr:protein kinase [Streptomyces sp. NBC_00083]MCX5385190.1 protein kinase [Streptomyces sp. NBC_00083]
MAVILGAGQALAQGRYVIEELIGEGGMAAVYRAVDTSLGRVVAVKTMNAAVASVPGNRERFRREARMMARLSEPHVVAVHDVGEESLAGAVVPFLVMEYVRGRDLGAYLRERPGGLPLDQALRITADVLMALAASHAQGLVHRDIKPANVLVTERGSVKVTDFGIARALCQDGAGTALTGTGFVIGTPHYMAPEQFEGRGAIDERADLYAVGVMLFELLTGAVPFDADTGNAIGYQHCTMTPPTLAEAGADVPSAVEDIVARALAKSRQDRFPDAPSMRLALVRLLPKRLEEEAGNRPTVLDSGATAADTDLHAARTRTGPVPGGGPGRPPALLAPPVHPPVPAGPASEPAHVPAPPQSPPTLAYVLPPTAPFAGPAPTTPRGLRERRRLIGRSYALIVLTLLLDVLVYRANIPRGLVVLPAVSSACGFWLAGKGGVASLTESRRVGSGLLQVSALLPLVIHSALGLAALVDIATVLSAP